MRGRIAEHTFQCDIAVLMQRHAHQIVIDVGRRQLHRELESVQAAERCVESRGEKKIAKALTSCQTPPRFTMSRTHSREHRIAVYMASL